MVSHAWLIKKKNEIERKLNQISIEERLANGAEIADGRDQAVDHTQMLDTSVHTMKNEHSDMDFNNNGLLPIGDANIPIVCSRNHKSLE